MQVCVQEKEKNYGTDSWVHALKREANWVPYVMLGPTEKDAPTEAVFTKLRAEMDLDELLAALAQFLHVSDPDVGPLPFLLSMSFSL